ncbi:hypothetical protein [Halalkalibacter urbisdiaboli]|uniref:hypothetical protein n=1 Tax=Halalkalibacter urbisdiaboli TaxID=1960589 RepID=UPI000B448765|nr:hypothetical protein [Halalkalibacter urbisdiaboli]
MNLFICVWCQVQIHHGLVNCETVMLKRKWMPVLSLKKRTGWGPTPAGGRAGGNPPAEPVSFTPACGKRAPPPVAEC